MIARLSRLSLDAVPTPFHKLLHDLDGRGKLLRVYTQNIDALEEKAGLTLGLPAHDYGRTRGRAKPIKSDRTSEDQTIEMDNLGIAPSSNQCSSLQARSTDDGEVSLISNATTSKETPRCIPLHGTLQTMHCVSCTHTFPLPEYLPSLLEGIPPDCPECRTLEATRSLVGKRLRGVGKLRPSVVLYNEDHRDGEDVGEVVRRDLIGSGRGRGNADLLIVVGTSLRVPGTKRIVREFSKAVKAKEQAKAERAHELAMSKLSLPTPASTPTSTPSSSPRRTPISDGDNGSEVPPSASESLEERPITSIYINLDFPVPTREWDGVFDVWIQGDAQTFATMIKDTMDQEEMYRIERLEREERVKEERKLREEARKQERERKEREKIEREKVAATKTKNSLDSKSKKRTPVQSDIVKPSKRRRVTLIVHEPPGPLTPPSTSNSRNTRCASNSNEITPTARLDKAKDLIETNSLIKAFASAEPLTTPKPRSSSLKSMAPHAYRVRKVPEVVIHTNPPDDAEILPCGSAKVSKGKPKLEEWESPLDLLANAAASLSLVHKHEAPQTPKKRALQPNIVIDSGSLLRSKHYNRAYQSSSAYPSPPPCSCPYPYSIQCGCNKGETQRHPHTKSARPGYLEIGQPASLSSALTPVPSPMLIPTSPPNVHREEGRCPGPPTVHQKNTKKLRSDIMSLLNSTGVHPHDDKFMTPTSLGCETDNDTNFSRPVKRSKTCRKSTPSKPSRTRRKAVTIVDPD